MRLQESTVMNSYEILAHLDKFRSEGLSLFATSSFQSHSLPLLHILAQASPTIPIVFVNTGYLFPESIEFKDEVANLLNLTIVEVRTNVPRTQQRDASGRLLYSTDPQRCCQTNKVDPLVPLLNSYDIWINGVRADQSTERNQFVALQPTKYRCQRFHPLLDWTARDIARYRQEHQLPKHPLEPHGYFSVGCEPCTVRAMLDEGRAGRWPGQSKTECGINTHLAARK